MGEKMGFDYIICGGGTSGCVIASRLAADPDVSVLLIEAGENCLDVEYSRMPAGMPNLLGGPHDWNFKSTPQSHAGDRQIDLTRGKFLGGSSGLNGTLCVRGTKQDYDDWDVPGWSGEEMFAAMRKAECFHGKDWFEAVESAHGRDGPVNIEPHDLAPISKRLLESFQDRGLPLDQDMFSTGERSHGCDHALRTVWNGERNTAAEYVRGWGGKNNLEILFKTRVSKVNLTKDGSGQLRATSVDVIQDPAGETKTYTARHEIILSAGTYCSPTILMRSGIGPKQELAKHNIPCQVDLPGVGQNLQDHLIVYVPYEVTPGLTHDDKVSNPEALKNSYMQWATERKGVLGTFLFGAFAFARLDDRLKDDLSWTKALKEADSGRDPMGLTPKQPHIEFFSTECGFVARDLPPDKNVFCLITQLFSPHSRGSVTLPSNASDPFADPIIDHAYFSHPLDLLVLTEGVRLGNEVVMQGKGTKDVVLDAFPPDLTQHHRFTSREQWMPFVRSSATTCYHPVGTCKMGASKNESIGALVRELGNGDDMVVVDERLKVRGVKGLRVADASIMPKIPNGHTCMPCYGIGERCAEIVREDWGGN